MNEISNRTSGVRKRLAISYAALDEQHQAIFLARLADQLSLLARDTYDVNGGVSNGAKLRAFNEAQNRILAQLLRLLTLDTDRYPDDVFANILIDQLQTLRLDPDQTLRGLLVKQQNGRREGGTARTNQ